MFELEALLLGLEPITALGIGLGSLALAPVVGVVGSAMGTDSAVGNSLTESSRSLAKSGLVWIIDTFDKAQTFVAEAGEAFQDLVVEAKTDINTAKSKAEQHSPPRDIQIG